ncbi:MAG: TetR/AcrR family transcriptional regulator [Gudongella sp.]|nr:TetR/AcrR family transcriptional regulator [Gudongella sp.]
MTSVREERREQIIKAAITVFGKRNFHKAKMVDIAKELQIGKSTIYEYFDSKKDLFEEMLMYIATGYYKFMKTEVGKYNNSKDKLVTFTTYHGKFMKDHLELVESAIIDTSFISEEVGKQILAKKEEVFKLLEDILIEGVESGELLEGLDTQLAACAVIGSINHSFAMQIYVKGLDADGVNPEKIIEMLYKGMRNTIHNSQSTNQN